MLTKLRSHLTYANVMATMAVFIAVGGGAYAAGLAKNSVGSKQIKDGQVKSKDVGDGSLLGQDFAPGQLPQGAKGEQGAQGLPGPAGKDGTDGTNGTDGTFGSITARSVDYISGDPAIADCLAGEVAVGGGVQTFQNGFVRVSAPLQSGATFPLNPTGWQGQIVNASNVAVPGTVWVMCAAR